MVRITAGLLVGHTEPQGSELTVFDDEFARQFPSRVEPHGYSKARYRRRDGTEYNELIA